MCCRRSSLTPTGLRNSHQAPIPGVFFAPPRHFLLFLETGVPQKPPFVRWAVNSDIRPSYRRHSKSLGRFAPAANCRKVRVLLKKSFQFLFGRLCQCKFGWGRRVAILDDKTQPFFLIPNQPGDHSPCGDDVLGLLAFLLIVLIGFSLATPQFLTVANFNSMAFHLPVPGLLTLAMFAPIVSAGLNLAIISTANISVRHWRRY